MPDWPSSILSHLSQQGELYRCMRWYQDSKQSQCITVSMTQVSERNKVQKQNVMKDNCCGLVEWAGWVGWLRCNQSGIRRRWLTFTLWTGLKEEQRNFFFFNSKSQGYVSTDEADADTVTSNLLLMGRLNPTLSHAHLLSQHITRWLVLDTLYLTLSHFIPPDSSDLLQVAQGPCTLHGGGPSAVKSPVAIRLRHWSHPRNGC